MMNWGQDGQRPLPLFTGADFFEKVAKKGTNFPRLYGVITPQEAYPGIRILTFHSNVSFILFRRVYRSFQWKRFVFRFCAAGKKQGGYRIGNRPAIHPPHPHEEEGLIPPLWTDH